MTFSHLTRVLFAASMLMLAACGRAPDRADLVVINGGEPDSIDPAKISGQPEGRIAYALYEGLTAFDETGTPQPGVAESWELSEDKKTYTFHLRSNAKWSNGDAVTSEDFAWSWLRVLSEPEAEYKYQLFSIRGAEAYADAIGKARVAQTGGTETPMPDPASVGIRTPDKSTLIVELSNPTPYFLDLCAFCTLLPVHRATVEKAEHEGSSWTKVSRLVGNGAFTLQEWRLNDRIRLKKSASYWNHTAVKMNTVDVIPAPTPNTAFNFYISGVADVILDKSMVPTSLISELKKRPDYHATPILATYFIRFNVQKKPFDDARVRKAISMAIDKTLITEKVTQAGEPPADAFVPPGTAGYQPPEGLKYNLDQARQFLTEAGYPGGKGLPVIHYLYTNRSETDEKIAVELQAMLSRELGIQIQLSKQEWAVYQNSLRSLNYDMSRSSWVGDYKDPNTFLDMFVTSSGNNNTGWGNPRYDQLIADAAKEPDTTKRFDLFRAAETLLVHDDAPICPLFNYVVISFHSDRLGGIQGNITDEHPFRAMYWKTEQ